MVLEELLRRPGNKSPVLGHVGLKEMVITGAWYIWWQRREFVKGAHVAPPMRSAFSIQALASNFGAASVKSVPHEVSWTKPPKQIYKLNADAAYVDGSGGAGAVIRNDVGEAIAGTCEPLRHIHDATTAEAWLSRWA